MTSVLCAMLSLAQWVWPRTPMRPALVLRDWNSRPAEMPGPYTEARGSAAVGELVQGLLRRTCEHRSAEQGSSDCAFITAQSNKVVA